MTQNTQQYKPPPIGQEISCVMQGIETSLLLKSNNLKKIVKEILNKEKFKILDISSYNFNPQGFTLIVLLAESHLAIHSYPEYSSIYFNMYSCRGSKDANKTFKFIKQKLKPKRILFFKENSVNIKGKN